MLQHLLVYILCEWCVMKHHCPLAIIPIVISRDFHRLLRRTLFQWKYFYIIFFIFLLCPTIICSVTFIYTPVSLSIKVSSLYQFCCYVNDMSFNAPLNNLVLVVRLYTAFNANNLSSIYFYDLWFPQIIIFQNQWIYLLRYL